MLYRLNLSAAARGVGHLLTQECTSPSSKRHKDLRQRHDSASKAPHGARRIGVAAESTGLRVAARERILFPVGSTQVISTGCETLKNIVEEKKWGKWRDRSCHPTRNAIPRAMRGPSSPTIDMMQHGELFPDRTAGAFHKSTFGGAQHRPEIVSHHSFPSIPAHRTPELSSTGASTRIITPARELNCIDTGKKIWWDLRPHPNIRHDGVQHVRHSNGA